MTPIISFILGLLFGWLVEWAIDWIYWRRRIQAQKAREAMLNQRVISLDRELVALSTGAPDPQKTRLEELVRRLEQELAELRARQPASPEQVPATPELVPDSREPDPAPLELNLVTPELPPAAPEMDQDTPEPVQNTRELAPDLPTLAPDSPEIESKTLVPVPDVSESVLENSKPDLDPPELVVPNIPEPVPDTSDLVPDDLTKIKGIGPVIARKLNQAGILTFGQLADQTPDSLRAVLGSRIERLANEGDLLEQARRFATEKQEKGAGEG